MRAVRHAKGSADGAVGMGLWVGVGEGRDMLKKVVVAQFVIA